MSVKEHMGSLPIQFGPYELYAFVGKGGMAEIFLARERTQLRSWKKVVIKRILPHLNNDEKFCQMLINEAKLSAGLNHSNIVSTYQLGKIDNQYYIAMEYVEGIDLNRLLGSLSKGKYALPLKFALYITLEVLKALDYAHRAEIPHKDTSGLIHRDVSPTNVLISVGGEVKLCDFGIAKVAQDEIDVNDKHVDTEHLEGKIAYMAPEHLAKRPIDGRADIYAVGILLWEMLNGRRLFKSKSPDETFKKVTEGLIPPLPEKRFPEQEMLEAIVNKALATDPGMRFKDGQMFLRAIEDYMHLTEQLVTQEQFSSFMEDAIGDVIHQQVETRNQLFAELPDNPVIQAAAAAVDTGDNSIENELLKGIDASAAVDSDSSRTTVADALEQKFAEESNKERKESGFNWAGSFLLVAAVGVLVFLALRFGGFL